MENTKFTPGTWVIKNGYNIFGPLGGESGDGVACDTNDGWQVAEVGEYPAFVGSELMELGSEVCNANARHIVKCVNAHDELVDALRGVLEFQGDYGANEIDMAKSHAEAYRVLNGLGDEK